MAEKEVAFHHAAIAVTEREHPRAVKERIESVNVLARLVGDDFQFAVAAIKQIMLHHRGGVAHGLVAVANADRFSAVASQRRAWPEVVVIDAMVIRHTLRLNLQRGRITGLVGKIAVVEAIGRAEQPYEELVASAYDRRFSQAAMAPGQPHAFSGRLPVLQQQPADEK